MFTASQLKLLDPIKPLTEIQSEKQHSSAVWGQSAFMDNKIFVNTKENVL